MKSLKETDGDLINHWYILCLENELTPGKIIKRWLYEMPYAVYKDIKGKVGVLQDRCPHRGAQLSLGTLDEDGLRCPYHGWKFNSAGELIEIPSDGPDHKSNLNCSASVRFQISGGCIWIWPGDPLKILGQDKPWQFPLQGQTDVVQYFMTTDFENEVGHLVQNFMDVPHTVFVHSKWFRNRSLIKVPVEIKVENSRVHVTYRQPKDSIGFTEKILNPEGHPTIHTDEFIFPNLTRVDYNFGNRFFIINSQCSPISRYQTRVYTWIAYNIGTLGPFLKPFMKFYTRKVITQDVEIMKNQGDNLKQWPDIEFKSTQADELHIAIEKLRDKGRLDRSEVKNISFSREREFWI